jgi:UDPglucose 6-dehydrogenase
MGGVIGFAGLSHLGIVSSIATAARGFAVMAYDPRPGWAAALAEGRLPVHEPDLPELLAGSRDRLTFTADAAALGACAVVVLSIDIPTSDDNRSDLSAIDRLAEDVVGKLAPGTTLVVLSQVRPGYTRALASRLAPVLAARKLRLYYQVETLIFGRAVERATRPERYIVGCADPAEPLPPAYHELLAAFGCPILPMRYESAELCKIAINIFLTASVTATNTLAEVCERTGADWAEIAPALRLDRRIGPHAYLGPGLGLAGGNLERDLATVQGLAAEHGTDARVIDAYVGNSAYRRDWALRTLYAGLDRSRGRPLVAVWGLAYKENTHSTKNSPSLALISSLPGVAVLAYDPQVTWTAPAGTDFREEATPVAACVGADALVVMTPWPQFAEVDLAAVRAAMRGRLLVDPHGRLDGGRAEALGFTYHKLGRPARERSEVA